MRLGGLGGYFAASATQELEPLCEILDKHGLSAIRAPDQFWEWSDEECYEFGEKARSLGIVVGEDNVKTNFLDPDEEAVAARIQRLRLMLCKADIMGVGCIATVVGSRDAQSGPFGPHPYNFTDEAKSQYREVCLRIVDGLDLKKTCYVIEPWWNTFFYRPEDILAFLESVGDPRVRLHLDQMNLVSQMNYFHTTELINRTFDLLADYVVSVHAKDVRWDPGYMFIKLDEVFVGDGVLDYDTFLPRVDSLKPDMPVYSEHFRTKEEYITAVGRLHQAAEKAGVRFLRRGER